MAIDMNNITPVVEAIDKLLVELDTEDSKTVESSVYSQFLFNIKAESLDKAEVETIAQSEANPKETNKSEKGDTGWAYRTPADGPSGANTLTQEEDTEINSDTTIYAKYVKVHKLSLSIGGEITTRNCCADETIADAIGEYAETENLVGWYADSALTIPIDTASYIDDNTTIYARIAEEYTITFNSFGVLQQVQIYGDETYQQAIDKLMLDNQYSIKWYHNANYTSEVNLGANVTENGLNLYARVATTSSLTIVPTEGASIDINVYEDESIEEALERTGTVINNLVAFYQEADYANIINTENFRIDKATIIYARVAANVNFTINIPNEDAKSVEAFSDESIADVVAELNLELPSNFVGWYINANKKDGEEFTDSTLAEVPSALYARCADLYTVYFWKNDAEFIAVEMYSDRNLNTLNFEELRLNVLEVETEAGTTATYQVENWYTNKAFAGSPVNRTTSIAEFDLNKEDNEFIVEIYGKFNRTKEGLINVTVVFDNGTTISKPVFQTYKNEETYNSLLKSHDIVVDNYDFYKKENYTDKLTITGTIGTSLAENGSVNIPITVDGIKFNRTFSWTKVRKGEKGDKGDAGSAANVPDWVTQWDSGKTTINNTTVLAPKIFAGAVSSGKPTGVAMGVNVFGTSGTYSNISGIAGYKNGTKIYHLSTDGSVLFGDTNGQYISWDGSNLKMNVNSLSISSNSVATVSAVNSAISSNNTTISNTYATKSEVTSDSIITKVTSTTQWTTQVKNISNIQNTADTALNTANSSASSVSALATKVTNVEEKTTSDSIVKAVTSSTTWTTLDGNVTKLGERVTTAEQKITSDKIVSTVTSSTSWSNLDKTASDAKSTANSAKSTADSAKSTADSAKSTADSASSSVTQLANKFAWVVKSGTSESSMTLTDKMYSLISSNITIQASKIKLEGYTTINGNFKIDTSGNMIAKNGTFTGDITGGTITGSKIIGSGTGNRILINNGDYEIQTGTTTKGFFGLRTLDDGYEACRLALSSTGLRRANDNYIVIQPYNKKGRGFPNSSHFS